MIQALIFFGPIYIFYPSSTPRTPLTRVAILGPGLFTAENFLIYKILEFDKSYYLNWIAQFIRETLDCIDIYFDL